MYGIQRMLISSLPTAESHGKRLFADIPLDGHACFRTWCKETEYASQLIQLTLLSISLMLMKRMQVSCSRKEFVGQLMVGAAATLIHVHTDLVLKCVHANPVVKFVKTIFIGIDLPTPPSQVILRAGQGQSEYYLHQYQCRQIGNAGLTEFENEKTIIDDACEEDEEGDEVRGGSTFARKTRHPMDEIMDIRGVHVADGGDKRFPLEMQTKIKGHANLHADTLHTFRVKCFKLSSVDLPPPQDLYEFFNPSVRLYRALEDGEFHVLDDDGGYVDPFCTATFRSGVFDLNRAMNALSAGESTLSVKQRLPVLLNRISKDTCFNRNTPNELHGASDCLRFVTAHAQRQSVTNSGILENW